MKQFIVDRHTTPNTPTLEQVPTDKIPLYPSEQDLLDDLANLEVGQIAGTVDPAESELIGVLIQRIQALENGEKYSTEEVKTNKKWWNGTEWKDIYRKTMSVNSYGNLFNTWIALSTLFPNQVPLNMEYVVDAKGYVIAYTNNKLTLVGGVCANTESVYYPETISRTSNSQVMLVLEYTKTSV